jgi:exopolysaccharide biosynthesis polyprenyl glycosylphosphotransferase
MLHNLGRARRVLLRLLDFVALIAAMPVAVLAYERVAEPPVWTPPVRETALLVSLALLFWTAAAWFHEVYEERGRTAGEEVRRALGALCTVAAAMLVFIFIAKQTGISRLTVGFYFASSAVALMLARVGCDAIAREARRRGFRLRYYAVVGRGALSREIVTTIAARREWGLNLAGFIDDESTDEPHLTDAVILGKLSELGKILEEHVLDEVIFAVSRAQLHSIERAILLCEEQGVAVRIALDVLRYGCSPMRLSDVDGLPMLTFTRTPSDLLAVAIKRTFDIAASSAVLLLLAPLLGLVALAIKLDSPGPVIFRQRRVGLNGHVFQILKFRSMHVDAEVRLEALRALNEVSGPVFKMSHDPRVTRVGRFIRKTSLDEFPQFWNVLRGDMSIVGPRPPLPSEVRQYKRWQRRRLSVRPGITCTWQISGRAGIDFDQWMALDLEYIDHWSLGGDLRICLKTIPAVLSTRGAH